MRMRCQVALAVWIGIAAAVSAQAPDTQASLERLATAATASARTGDAPATLVFANRRIVQFRATVLGRTPFDRVASITELLGRLVEAGPVPRMTVRAAGGASVVMTGDQLIFAVFPQDVDGLTGETPDKVAAAATTRLHRALDEVVEIRTPGRVLGAAVNAVAGTLLFLFGLWGILRLYRRGVTRISQAAAARLERLPGGAVLARVADARAGVRRLIVLLLGLVGFAFAYAWLGFVLRQFPYTRPLGESLRGGVLSIAATIGHGILSELPNLAMVVAIFLITRFLVRLVGLAFAAAEEGRLTLPWVYPETALPTRRIAAAILWGFALVMSYEYLPGAGSDAFKGISVFAGLIISLGSSGVMNQAMSGLMLMYSRALRIGDFVKIGEVEGTVTHLGSLSTKVRTPRNEEITIPNALVVANATTNFTRNAEGGVFTPTSVTIGYDVPWRQVHALLLLAAERTEGVRRAPAPVVFQTALSDFYVQYTLLVSLMNPARRVPSLAVLHANIQDAFNEYGVQIMSPNYEADPEQRKLVPQQDWYAAPAVRPVEGAPAHRGEPQTT
jgi:small-conductance mechanosensitive channel